MFYSQIGWQRTQLGKYLMKAFGDIWKHLWALWEQHWILWSCSPLSSSSRMTCTGMPDQATKTCIRTHAALMLKRAMPMFTMSSRLCWRTCTWPGTPASTSASSGSSSRSPSPGCLDITNCKGHLIEILIVTLKCAEEKHICSHSFLLEVQGISMLICGMWWLP